ncbi:MULTISPECIES: hypothetical protein [Flavobacterium]|uniref:Uncharacterized protein n=1 Tax=Flavobacterium covae TaxID=2906076 RepID=A0ABW8PCX1_9FLAO|nr:MULTISPECIES: hypothetical protein [Flavobacterium]
MKNTIINFILVFSLQFLNAQEANSLKINDTRNTNDAPNFFEHGIKADFKLNSVIGITNPFSGTYSTNLTIGQWDNWNNSGGKHHQLNFNDSGLYYRNALPLDGQWGGWNKLLMAQEGGNLDFFNTSPNRKISGHGDPINYYIGHYNVVGSSGLDLHWHGGIKFGTSVGDIMQITQNGNVGIGTNSPSERLEVNGGSLKITASGNEGAALSLYNSTKTAAGAVWRMHNMTGNYGNSLQFWNYPSDFSSANQRMILYDNGDMNVNGTLTTSKNLYTNDIVTSGSNSWIFHTPDDGRTSLQIAPSINNAWKWDKAFVLKNDGSAYLQGKLAVTELKVTTTPTADFVFEETYNLPKLDDVEKHIKEKKHLPEIASAKEMEKEGVNVGEFQIKLLQKIEELTLYSIEQNKQILELKKEVELLKLKNKK